MISKLQAAQIALAGGEDGMDLVRKIVEGACDYLVKPCSPDQLRIAVARQLDTRRLLDRLENFERESQASSFQMSSRSESMNQALRVANQVAQTDANVLLLGESGTGKGVLAAAIQREILVQTALGLPRSKR